MQNHNDTFCLVPWVGVEIKHNNLCSLCCMHKENIKLDNGEVADLSKHSIDTILDSSFVKTIKNDFEQGLKPEICNACWHQESNSFISKRQVYFNSLKSKSTDTNNILYLDVKMGKARYKKSVLSGVDISSTTLPKNDQYWENIFKIIPTVQELEFTGECFELPEHSKLIDFIIESGHAPDMLLHYKTNGSKVITHLKDKWKLFKSIRLTLSLYDIEECFLSDWYECTWTDLTKNLNSTFELIQDLPNLNLGLVSTIDNDNRHRKEVIYNWAKQYPFSSIIFNEK